jgi:hypothetical protein
MKKIENWLLLPVLILLFYAASKYSSTTTDIHYHDIYFVVSNGAIAGCCLIWLGIVFILFKIIRRRHQLVNIKFAIPYYMLTGLIFLVFWLPTSAETGENGISDSQLDWWLFYNQLRILSGYIFLFAQVTFLIYFIFQLFRRPLSKL